MSKHVKNPRSTLAGKVVPLVVATALAVTAAPAGAAATKIGPIKGLDITLTKPAERYVVTSDWNDLAGATTYKVSLTSGGAVLQSDRVTESAWRATTTLPAGRSVRVKIVPMAGKRAGRQTTSAAIPLPDLTAPTGTFTLEQDSPGSEHVTVQQLALSDDVTAPADIVRTISWGEGMPFQAWSDGTHSYLVDLQAYAPTVRLRDAAGNTREVPLGTVVVDDHTGPSGAFGVSEKGWAGWSKVELTETTAVEDNFVDAANVITRRVDWGDGSQNTWTGGALPTHVYSAAGTYNPEVTLVDKAGNTSEAVMGNSVVVTADTGKPTVTLAKPATARRTWVRKWVSLHGKAKDAATGVRVVKLRLVEKRGTTWYAFRGTTRRWVRGGSTEAAALRRSTPAKAKPNALGTWSYKVAGLRKGRLVVRVQSMDNVKNKSAVRTVAQKLSHS